MYWANRFFFLYIYQRHIIQYVSVYILYMSLIFICKWKDLLKDLKTLRFFRHGKINQREWINCTTYCDLRVYSSDVSVSCILIEISFWNYFQNMWYKWKIAMNLIIIIINLTLWKNCVFPISSFWEMKFSNFITNQVSFFSWNFERNAYPRMCPSPAAHALDLISIGQ